MIVVKFVHTFKKFSTHLLLIAGLLVFSITSLNAQTPISDNTIEVQSSIDTNVITIGEQTKVHLQITLQEGQTIQWPVFTDTLSKYIEIIHISDIDTIQDTDNEKNKLIQTITISSFDSGYYVIPPFYFHYSNQKEIISTSIKTQPLLIEVKNVAIDLKKEIKDIKPILEEPWTFREMLPYFLILLGAIILIFLAIYIYKRRKQNKPIFRLPQKPKIPSHITAIKKLDILKDKKLWQKGSSKEFYSELTDILREYMEGQMNFGAMEMVSDDILIELEKQITDLELLNDTRQILQTADLVKFAKVEPLADENDRALKWGYSFVEFTKPVELAQENRAQNKLEVEPPKDLNS